MTPGARVAAAIEILDVIAAGAAAEQALTRWAGSKDRAPSRDNPTHLDVPVNLQDAAVLAIIAQFPDTKRRFE